MHTVLSIVNITVCLVISLTCGIVMGRKRKEVSDRSRLFLAIFNLQVAALCILRLSTYVLQPTLQVYHAVLAPFLLIGGMASIILYLLYPIEVVNPGWLNWRRGLLLAAPELLVIVLVLLGLRFQPLTYLSDIWAHVFDVDVLVRLGIVACVIAYTFLLWFIPYNWRESSANSRWIWKTNMLTFIMGLLFLTQVFTRWPIFHHVHILWICFALAYYTWFEVFERLNPVAFTHTAQHAKVPKNDEQQDVLWLRICQTMDEWEAWRNPDTTAESLSMALGTNRIYLARCIKEHTGLTFNDYLNSQRVEFMADQLQRDPQRDHKSLYYEAGFRSRQTAFRNFVKFKGVSPTEFIAS